MKSVNELLIMFMRQAQFERAIKRPQRELEPVKQKSAALPGPMLRNAIAQDL
jgi:hypothetical protein